MTDVIGELVSVDGASVAVRGQGGELVQIASDRVVALKALGPKPVRTKDVRALEIAASDGWPGLEREWIDGWQLRFGYGFTGRANSAAPLLPEAAVTDRSLASISRWFAARGLPAVLSLPDRLGGVPAEWETYNESVVLAAPIDTLVLPPGAPLVTLHPEPTPDWLGALHYQGEAAPPNAAEVAASVRNGELGFGVVGGGEAPVLAVGRGAVTASPDGRRWVGLSSIFVAPEHRRHGLGTAVCGDLVRWGRERGATHAYLQVFAENEPALQVYRDIGFTEHHRYRYARLPLP